MLRRSLETTPRISCEAVPASVLAGAGMRRHVRSGHHAAEGFVSFIALFDGVALLGFYRRLNCVGEVLKAFSAHATNAVA